MHQVACQEHGRLFTSFFGDLSLSRHPKNRPTCATGTGLCHDAWSQCATTCNRMLRSWNRMELCNDEDFHGKLCVTFWLCI